MSSLIRLINDIRKKPVLYIGQKSISNLYMFLNGYRHACYEHGLSSSEDEKIFRDFQEWTQQYFSIKISQSWSNIILFHSPNEDYAFDQFFELFNQFINETQAKQES